jgi:adenylate kinase
MHNIVMLGPQGSGKGTQAELLSTRLNIPTISSGSLFRLEVEKKTDLGKLIAKFTEAGEFVPWEIAEQIINQRLSEPDTSHGLILDGFPRNVEQAKALAKIFEKTKRQLTDVIYIKISEEEALRRLSGRRVCLNKKCEAIYHIEFNQPRGNIEKCDRCGSDLVQRADDTPEAIRRRLDLYQRETAPLIDFYKQCGILREINGEQSVVQVAESIASVLRI